jgi:hypothetical protein
MNLNEIATAPTHHNESE